MRYRLSPILNFLGGLESLHIAYSNKRLGTAGIARRMIIMTTGDAVKNRFPHLNVTWEILDYDSPARIEAKTLTGKFESFVIEGFDKSKRAEILDNWKFNASLDPFHEVLAPKIPESAG
ncbi:conserved Plasmodium protein, unknown function [Babesia microti strain RI]|uniref:Uncharacterized protein n=1 Tax=Babesia microti (strain RI) TaxID=1133968 RepID=A0A1N6LWS8_BABMR|nr:conserved Plasmodium protein, unknown function [Babesia microti strain RI]SIO73324.1 conserved Plasmodium protein, unknown function [Babesia microti strain RI]|eukprot:XP_021337426.1 conserved Plasmodium protein, unknown function [Babesia microti strain RI]